MQHPPTLENIILVRLVYSTPFTLKLSVHGHFNDEKLTKLIKKKYANKSIAFFSFFFNGGHFIDLKKYLFNATYIITISVKVKQNSMFYTMECKKKNYGVAEMVLLTMMMW